MQVPAGDNRTLDLEDLEFNSAPIFVIRVGTSALPFDLLYANEAFRKGGFRESVLVQDGTALFFRSWAQAVGQLNKPQYDFAGRTWVAEVAGRNLAFKVVRAAGFVTKEQDHQDGSMSMQTTKATPGSFAQRRPAYKRARKEFLQCTRPDETLSLSAIPRTNLTARWETIQTMMEMSDVGVFEYNMEGKLLNANEAWYRLSSHPRNLPAHVEFSFMDLVYPEDQPLVLSMWNTLVQGSPVTFEMRWKPRVGTQDAAQWVLSACVPVYDDEGSIITIAGNTIDIGGQKRSQEAAQARVEALEQAKLSELKFARFAQLSPTAIYIFVPKSGMEFVNDQFFELTGYSRAPVSQFEWFNLIVDEDVKMVEEDWADMLESKKSDGVQFRLKKTWVNQDGIRSNVWVQSSSYAQVDEHGNVISIMGTLFDISQFKWAESVQRRRIEEAWEAKRQQENFIDMTSHELRNPLSAVVQCADSVIATLQHLPINLSTAPPTDLKSKKIQEDINTSIDALQTIVSCSLHQKRVIDDVLTLSKLDSNLILITPMRVQPAVVVTEAMKMFDVECHQMGVQLHFIVDDTLEGFEWVMLDPSRLVQILINLLTNAIKFTKDQPERRVTVKLGGSSTRPPKVWQCVNFMADDGSRTDLLDKPEWGNGKKGYIWIKVTDTGCGMAAKEQEKLFSRFSQATPRTHVKYGGSGLGLFISKSLATLQGGAIGVFSEGNVGSTFAFFVGTRIANPPAGQVHTHSPQAWPMHQRTVFADEFMMAVKLNILVVEDNVVNQNVLKRQLQKFGWNVSVAGDGKDALEWLKGSVYWRAKDGEMGSGTNESSSNNSPARSKHELDIILMDIEMPIMDGLTCTRLIRDYEYQGLLGLPETPSLSQKQPSTLSESPTSSFNDPNCSSERLPQQRTRLPILAVSANARMEQIEQALTAGMDDAISKPFRIPELWPKLQGLIPKLRESRDSNNTINTGVGLQLHRQ